MLDNELIIREPKVPLRNRIIFSIAFGLFFILIIYILKPNIYNLLNSDDKIRISIYLILLFVFLFLSFTPIILRHNIHLNFSESKIRHIYELGIFTFHERWQDLVDLKYISIYKVGHYYRVNMWYENNKILNLFVTEKFDMAIQNGFHIANKLHIDLLDASVKGNQKWINKTVYGKTSKIEYL